MTTKLALGNNPQDSCLSTSPLISPCLTAATDDRCHVNLKNKKNDMKKSYLGIWLLQKKNPSSGSGTHITQLITACNSSSFGDPRSLASTGSCTHLNIHALTPEHMYT